MMHPALLSLALGTLGVIAALAEDPSLNVPQSVEVAKPFNVTCITHSNVSAENFTITANNRKLPVTLSQDGHQATAEVTLNKTARVVCAILVGGVEKRTEKNVPAFYVPEPWLTVSSSTPAAGTVLNGTCNLPDEKTTDIRVRVLSSDGKLNLQGQFPLPFELPVREEDGEMELTCEASLENIIKRKSVQIVVHTKPRLDNEGCPRQQNWTEGQKENLTCQAEGRPKPEVKCFKDGRFFNAGIAYDVTLTSAGTYLCQATNALGTAERNVTIWVQAAEDRSLLLPVLLGVLLPVLTLLGLAGLYALYHHNTKIGQYWLWKRHSPAEMKPLQPPRSSEAVATPNGSAPGAP